MKLHELKIGQTAKIVTVNASPALRARLFSMGLVPETVVKLLTIAPPGEPLEFEVRGTRVSLRRDEAETILVEPLKESKNG